MPQTPPLKFLFTVHNFLPARIYGAEKVCLEQMRELLAQGFQVGLFYAANQPLGLAEKSRLGLDGLRLYRVPFWDTKAQILASAWNPRMTRAFERAMADFQPDVAVFHHLLRLSLDLPLAARRRGVSAIFYLHDFYLVCPLYTLLHSNGKFCPGGSVPRCANCIWRTRFSAAGLVFPATLAVSAPFLMMRHRLIRKIREAVDLFISPSRFLLTQMQQHGFQPKTARVLPNGGRGVESRPPQPLQRPLRFGYMGNIHPKKGLDVLAEAFDGALGRHLLIRGFENQAAMAAFKARHPRIEASLEIFNRDLEDFFSKVDVVILPSIWYENQPTAIIEAFDHRKPVICSDIGGMAEMVRHGKWGLHFKTGDAQDLRDKVTWLMAHPELAQKMGWSAPNWPTTAENAEKLAQAAIGLVRQRRKKMG